MKFNLSILIFALLFYQLGNAQEVTPKEQKKSKKDEVPHKGSVYFTPLPVLSSNPSFGFMYGVATSTSWYMGDPKTTNIS